MKTLKKNNISQESAINSPVPVNKNCDLPPFFNEDYFGHVVVQTIAELNDIPCDLRQDGMLATVVQDSYAEWQLQSSRIGFSKCDNRSWVRIGKGEAVYDGNNLMIFSDTTALNMFLDSQYALEGMLVYVTSQKRYFRVDASGVKKVLVDPFPEKLTVPKDNTTIEDESLLIPVYKNGVTPLWKSYGSFGKVHTVNHKLPGFDRNINIGLDEVLGVGPPTQEDTLSIAASTKRVLLYDPRDNKSYWKKISDVGKISTVDYIEPVGGNIDLSGRYYTQTYINDTFIKKPTLDSSNQDYRVILVDPTTQESYSIRLGDIIPNILVDESLFVNADNLLGVNTTSAITEKVINSFENITYPIDISLDYNYTEISDIFINSCLKLPRDYYYIISNNRIKIKDFSDLINTENWEKLFIEITGTKNINYEQ